VIALFLTTACSDPRLEGPSYGTDGPPWVAPGQEVAVAPLVTDHRLVLIGDTGLWLEDDPTLLALGAWTADVPSTVVFLGDNVYDDGLVDEDRERGEKILGQQLEATPAAKVFVPGNHDWGMDPAQMNVRAIRNQQAFVDGFEGGSAAFLPKDGCMGPASLELLAPAEGRAGLVAVFVDPTPWINPRLREVCVSDGSHEAHLAKLEQILADAAGSHVVLASHYPFVTGGPHGGLSYGAIGDVIVGFLAWRYGGLGNTYEPTYADWIAATSEVLRRHRPALVAAGHDHSLQILEAGDVAGAYVVSGAGSPDRVSTVTNIPSTIFAHAHPGFVIADFGRRGEEAAVVLRVIENGKPCAVFEMDVASTR
jgi:hypothetical protein